MLAVLVVFYSLFQPVFMEQILSCITKFWPLNTKYLHAILILYESRLVSDLIAKELINSLIIC